MPERAKEGIGGDHRVGPIAGLSATGRRARCTNGGRRAKVPGVLMEHGTPPRHDAAACKRGPARDRAEGLRGFSDATMATSSPEGGRPPIGPSLASSSMYVCMYIYVYMYVYNSFLLIALHAL